MKYNMKKMVRENENNTEAFQKPGRPVESTNKNADAIFHYSVTLINMGNIILCGEQDKINTTKYTHNDRLKDHLFLSTYHCGTCHTEFLQNNSRITFSICSITFI